MIAQPALDLVDAVADQLADPHTAHLGAAVSCRQNLAHGLPGIALLHIERAAAGLGPWQRAHDWLAAASREAFTSGPDSHPFYGAPDFAHALACVADHLPGAYQRALGTLDRQLAADVSRRLDAAHRRMDAERLPELAEFDTIRGLTGYGAYLLHRNPGAPALRAVLDYCVRLTQPITHDGESLPGWWTDTGSSGCPDDRFPGGHGNFVLAHGIGGVLALLALAARNGSVTDGTTQRCAPSWPGWTAGRRRPAAGRSGRTGSLRASCAGGVSARQPPGGRPGATAPLASPALSNLPRLPSAMPAARLTRRTRSGPASPILSS